MKTLIKNGTLVLRDGEKKADILIEDGKISKISANIKADCKVIDAAGKHVLAAHVPFFLGVACYFALRYAGHVLSGVIFYGDYIAWEGWWQQHLVVYSFAYNGVFFIPDTLIALGAAIGVLSSKSFNSFMATSAGAAEGVRSTGAADILYESGADVTAPADTLQNSHAAAENDERTAPRADER